jgi:putative transposase
MKRQRSLQPQSCGGGRDDPAASWACRSRSLEQAGHVGFPFGYLTNRKDPPMTHPNQHPTVTPELLELVSQEGLAGMPKAIAILLNEAMKIERSQTLNAAPYQRTDARLGHANGFKDKTLATRLGPITFQIPQTRGIAFYPSALEKGVRSERALKLAIAEMYVQGVSTRKVTAVMQELCGLEVSSTDVSRAAELLDEELEAWRSRPLGQVPAVFFDARYEKIRHGGSVVSCAVLIASGILPDGKRSVLGVSVSLSEAEVHWRSFMSQLQNRGLHGTELIVSDDHAGLKAAREARFPGVPWQRCQFHLQHNAQAYVPRQHLKKQVASDLKAIFTAPDCHEAQRLLKQAVERYAKEAPKLAQWMEHNVPEGLTVMSRPAPQRPRLRTTNILERTNKEILRRTRVATLFPNEPSLLRLVSAVLAEIDEEWTTGKIYLNLENQ